MKLKQSEKNIIYFLVVALIVVAAYFLGFRNISAQQEKVAKEVDDLISTYNSLKQMAANADNYAKDTVEFDEKSAELYAKYDNGYSQEYTIKFLEGIEEQTNAWVKSASLSESTKIFTFGNIKSSNPTNPGVSVYSSDNLGYSTSSSVSFQASYEETKDMIDYILTNKYKCTFENFSVSYNADADIVTGSFVVSQYAITGADRFFEGPIINNGSFGTDNIFNSSIFNAGEEDDTNGANITSDHDIYITLQGHDTDVGAFSMGMKDDATGISIINSEDNAVQDVTIRVTGKENNYKISYKVGNITYPISGYADGEAFTPGNMLSMVVFGSERDDINDKSGANLTIINETDMTFYIKVLNDDLVNPRFTIKHKSGDVVVYED